jgi:hypothetical protein
MSKKEFKERCSFHVYGKGQRKLNAIYYDWQFHGYKYVVKGNINNIKLNELFNVLYNWVNKNEVPPYYVDYNYAETDEGRFKVKISERC